MQVYIIPNRLRLEAKERIHTKCVSPGTSSQRMRNKATNSDDSPSSSGQLSDLSLWPNVFFSLYKYRRSSEGSTNDFARMRNYLETHTSQVADVAFPPMALSP